MTSRTSRDAARQILVHPMLDDRNTVADPALEGFVTWSCDDNATGWGALLGDARIGTAFCAASDAGRTRWEAVAAELSASLVQVRRAVRPGGPATHLRTIALDERWDGGAAHAAE